MRTVFLSSTGRDLQPYRDAVFDAIRKLEGWHGVRMEDFTSADLTVREFCRGRASGSDVFVGILGHCYGSIPKGDVLSYTEHEYEAAVAAGKPRLMFLAPEDFPVPKRLWEEQSADDRRRQESFRARAQQDQLTARPEAFASPGGLANEVLAALYNWLDRTAGREVLKSEDLREIRLLAKLLDRTAHESAIRKRLRDLRRDGLSERLLVILPGRIRDCHRDFVERFGCHDLRFSVPEDRGGCTWADMRWMPGSLEELLLEIGGCLFSRSLASVEALHKEIACLRKPVCFAHYITRDQWRRDNGRLVRQWVDHFIHQWPASEPGVPVIAFLCLVLGERQGSALQWLIGRDRLQFFVKELRRRENRHLLITDPLDPIVHNDVAEWIALVKQLRPTLADALAGAERRVFPDENVRCDFEEVYEKLVDLLQDALGMRHCRPRFAR